MLNSKIAKELSINNNLFLVVVVQFNAKRHLINRYQIYKFVKEKSQDVYIFPASYIRSKTRNGNLVTSKKLFPVQDRGVVIGPGLLYYTKGMPTAMLSNVYTPISLMNRARYISVSIVLNDDNMFNLRLVDNQANNYSNPLLPRCK